MGTISVNSVLSFPCPSCKATAGNYCEEADVTTLELTKLPPDAQHYKRQKLAAENLPIIARERAIARNGMHETDCTKAHDHSKPCNCYLASNYNLNPPPTPDPINPSHYKGDLVMRIIEHFGLQDDFALGNVIKYILRHKNKAGVEDLRKARWYLDRRIAQLDGSLKGTLE